LLLYRNDINNNFTLFNIERIEPFFNFYNRRNNKYSNYVINFFLKDLNVKLLYKINFSKSLFFSINKFYNFNLIEFYNFKNRLDSYKNVMLIDSVYEYRFANSSFKTMDEFIVTIFKTPLENYLFFNDLYKQFSYNIVYKMIKGIEEFFFFQDFNNLNNQKYFKNLTIPFKYFNRLFKT
jgi:hypothetical protein